MMNWTIDNVETSRDNKVDQYIIEVTEYIIEFL